MWLENLTAWLWPDSASAQRVHARHGSNMQFAAAGTPRSGAPSPDGPGFSNNLSPRSLGGGSSAAKPRWRSFCSTALWFALALLGVAVGVAITEFFMDLQVHAGRLALLAVPSSVVPLDYDSLISLHERSVSISKDLNKRLSELADRESKIHYLHAELANRDVLVANYKVLVARMRVLRQQQHEQELREKEKQVERVLRMQLGLPAPPGEENEAASALDSTLASVLGGAAAAPQAGSPPPSSAEVAKSRARLLTLIFGNKTLEESRRDLDLSSPDLAAPIIHGEEEIAQLVREEKEAQAAAARDGFLALASRAARGDAPKTAELQMEAVMRVSDDGEIMGPVGGGGAGAAAAGGGASAGFAAAGAGFTSPAL